MLNGKIYQTKLKKITCIAHKQYFIEFHSKDTIYIEETEILKQILPLANKFNIDLQYISILYLKIKKYSTTLDLYNLVQRYCI